MSTLLDLAIWLSFKNSTTSGLLSRLALALVLALAPANQVRRTKSVGTVTKAVRVFLIWAASMQTKPRVVLFPAPAALRRRRAPAPQRLLVKPQHPTAVLKRLSVHLKHPTLLLKPPTLLRPPPATRVL